MSDQPVPTENPQTADPTTSPTTNPGAPPPTPANTPTQPEPTLPEVQQSLDESRYDLEFPYVPLSAMNPAKYNPREISDEALAVLEKSMEKGLLQPIVWNKRTGNIIGGHQRYKILKKNGIKQVKTCVLDCDEIEEMEINVNLNNPAAQGEFNIKMLADVIKLLKSKKTAQQFKDSGLEALAKQLPLFDGVNETPTADTPKTRLSAEAQAEEKLERADVKMLQLFYSSAQHKDVMMWIAQASEACGTDNASDTIFTLLKAFNENLQPAQTEQPPAEPAPEEPAPTAAATTTTQ